MKGAGLGGIYGVKGAFGGSSVFAKAFGPALYLTMYPKIRLLHPSRSLQERLDEADSSGKFALQAVIAHRGDSKPKNVFFSDSGPKLFRK